MALNLFQIIVLSVEVLGAALGVVLFCRHLNLPGTKSYGLWTGRLAYWPVTGPELGLLIALILLLSTILPGLLSTVFGGVLKSAAEKPGLEMAGGGIAMTGGGLLAWPLFYYLRQRLQAGYNPNAPAATPATNPAKCSGVKACLDGGATFLIALPLILLVGEGWMRYLQFIGYPVAPQEAITLFRNTHSPLILSGMYLVACVLAPMNEELLFRRGLYHFLRQRISRNLALGISAGCFGLVHQNVAGLIPLTLLGLILALAYERTGDIRVPIIAHGLFNLNTLLFLLAGFSD